MASSVTVTNRSLGLRVGDVVEIRSEEDLLATLDDRGRLDGLPLMPEMLKFCGQRFRVYKRADKTCDPVTTQRGAHIRRMYDTVHLEGLRCDGSAHDGCQAGCLIYWKEAWLKPVDRVGASAIEDTTPRVDGLLPLVGSATRTTLEQQTRVLDEASGSTTYSCQATDVVEASSPMPWWSPAQYVRDLRSGNVRIGELLVGLGILLFNKFQTANQIFFPSFKLIRNGRRYPFIQGKLQWKTPQATLNLEPGELVRVKSKEEIEATLNAKSENRGLRFSTEMVQYCGKMARVARRVDKIIDENSGKMITMKNPCIILDDVICTGRCFQMCPRSTLPYWREIWLQRVEEAPATAGATADHQGT